MDAVLERIANALERIADKIDSCDSKAPQKQEVAKQPVTAELDFGMPTGSPVPAEPKVSKKKAAAAPAPVAPSEKPLTLPDVADMVRKLVVSDAAKGHEKAVSILATFGAKRIGELKEADFPKVIAKINEILAVVKQS